jgi:hypothetical protein
LRGFEVGRLARDRGAFVVFGGIHATLIPARRKSSAVRTPLCWGTATSSGRRCWPIASTADRSRCTTAGE